MSPLRPAVMLFFMNKKHFLIIKTGFYEVLTIVSVLPTVDGGQQHTQDLKSSRSNKLLL